MTDATEDAAEDPDVGMDVDVDGAQATSIGIPMIATKNMRMKRAYRGTQRGNSRFLFLYFSLPSPLIRSLYSYRSA